MQNRVYIIYQFVGFEPKIIQESFAVKDAAYDFERKIQESLDKLGLKLDYYLCFYIKDAY